MEGAIVYIHSAHKILCTGGGPRGDICYCNSSLHPYSSVLGFKHLIQNKVLTLFCSGGKIKPALYQNLNTIEKILPQNVVDH